MATLAVSAAPGASGSTVVTMTVPSATTLDLTACGSAGWNHLSLGVVQPGASVSTDPCTIEFGSSNDTAMLKVYQQDGSGSAMWRIADSIDTGWGTSGYSDLGNTGNVGNHDIESSHSFSDGRTLVAGMLPMGGGIYGAGAMMFDATGALVYVSDLVVPAPATSIGTVYGLHVAQDGSYYVGVGYEISPFDDDAAVVRFASDGTLDTSWGGGDGVSDPIDGGPDDRIRNVSVTSDGSIHGFGAHDGGGVVYRWLANGDADTSWHGDGASQATGANSNLVGGILLDDGKLRAGGSANYYEAMIAQFDATGSLDTSWGGGDGLSDSVDPTGSSGDGSIRTMLSLPDGRTIIATTSEAATENVWGLVMFDSLGDVDTSFGDGDGIAELVNPGDPATYGEQLQTIVLPDGSFIGVGEGQIGGEEDAAIVRWRPDGSVDTNWASSGVLHVAGPGAPGSNEPAFTVTLAGDGALVAGIRTSYSDVALVRVDTSDDLAQYDVGNTDWDDGPSTFAGCLASVGAGATDAPGTWSRDVAGSPGDCALVDSDPWNAIAESASDLSAKVAETTGAGVTGAQVSIVFGARAAPTQARGSYLAPVIVETIAPEA